MVLKQNTFKSETNSTESMQGYSLKKQSLKKWIYENGYSLPYVARRLNLPPDVFKEKLTERSRFDREQLDNLIRLMGTKAAFKVIYFSNGEKRQGFFTRCSSNRKCGSWRWNE